MCHLIKTVLLALPRIIYCYFAWMIKYSNHPEKFSKEERYQKCQNLVNYLLKKLRVTVEVEGKENIPEGVACYYGNHMGASDPILYFSVFDKPIAFVGKSELRKFPFVWRIIAAIDGIFLDRKDLKQQLRTMMKVEKDLTDRTTSYFIYPEGTRNHDPLSNLLPFHKGTFRSAMKAGVPIVPCVNYGAFRITSLKSKHRNYPTVVKVLKPILPEEYANMTTDDVANKVQSMIQKEITFNVRLKDHQLMQKQNPKDYCFNKIY